MDDELLLNKDCKDWITFQKQSYKLFHYNDMKEDFQQLQFKELHMAIARYGGPIAVLKNNNYGSRSQKSPIQKDLLYFYDTRGFLQNQRPFKYEEDVVAFDFIESEFLFILFHTGKYVLIDPYTGK